MANEAIPRNLMPTDQDVAAYQRRGWFVSPKIISEDMLEEARYGVQRYFAGERDTQLPLAGGFLDWRSEHGNTLRLNDYVSLQNEQIRSLVRLPILGAIAARLAGCIVIRLFHDQLVSKPPHTTDDETAIGWHVDAAYWNTCTSRSMLTAWIPLQDCTEDNGTVMMIDGSHLWAASDDFRTFDKHDLTQLEDGIVKSGHRVEKIPMLLQAGQVSFHHCMTIHGSTPNRSQRDRIALTVHMQDGDNRYREHVDSRGQPTIHINDMLCRGGSDGCPDYSDPEVCPVLWDETSDISV